MAAEKIYAYKTPLEPIVEIRAKTFSPLECSWSIGFINSKSGEFAPPTLKTQLEEKKVRGAEVSPEVEELLAVALLASADHRDLLISELGRA